MIFAVIGSMSAIGSIIYLQVYGLLYKKNPQSPWLSFAVIAIIDAIFLVFLLICIFIGKFGDPAAGTVVDSELEALKGGSDSDVQYKQSNVVMKSAFTAENIQEN